MESWDDDDYDPTAHVSAKLADAVATFGLDEKLRAAATKAEAEKKSIAAAAAKNSKSSTNAQRNREMTQAEILELQKHGELEMFADLLGVEMDDKKYGELETRAEFTEYARKAGTAFAEQSDAQFYSEFVHTLVDQITQPLTKFQLENIVSRLNDRVKQLAEAEALERAEKEKAAEQKKNASKGGQANKKKTTIKKEVYEDCLEDDYDEYMGIEDNY